MAFLMSMVLLLAAGFTYAHQKLYQRRFEHDLLEQSTRALREAPGLARVSVTFEGLNARLRGRVADPRARADARSRVFRLQGVNLPEANNQIQVEPSLTLILSSGAPPKITGWLPAGDWRDRLSNLLSAASPGTSWDLAKFPTNPAVAEPFFLSQPVLPEFLQQCFLSITQGTVVVENSRIRMTGQVQDDTRKQTLDSLASRVLSGPGGSTLENLLEARVMSTTRPGQAAAFSWVGFDLARVLSSFPLQFDSGSAVLRAEETAKIDRIASALQQLGPNRSLWITGHAEAGTASAANLKLALRRAEAVAAQLSIRGVGKDRLAVRTTLDRAPAGKPTAETRKQSRRVEVSLK